MKLIKISIFNLLLIFLGLVLVVPQLALGTGSDVQFSSGSTLVVTAGSALELTVTGNMESLEVAGGTFTPAVTSSAIITSNDRTTYTYGTGMDAVFSCGGSSSTLTLNGGGSLVVTPTGTVCQQSSGGSGGGGGGTPTASPSPTSSGGGGSITPVASPTPSVSVAPSPLALASPAPTQTPSAATPTLTPAAAVSAVFARSLGYGASGEDVKRLQVLLNSDPATRIAASGVGSSGRETTRFFGATRAAVIKFQRKWGITPASGYVGSLTRAKLRQVFGGASQPTPQSSPSVSAPQTSAPTPANANLQAQLRAAREQLNALLQQLRARQGGQ